ncbi:MAG: serine hydrolase [Ignavibacteriaceae bacterium]|nr:serine hydrolase [Ignavibacteriaceae bacterium]
MKLLRVLIFSAVFYCLPLNAQNYYFPPLSGSQWDTVSLSGLGWNIEQLPPLYSFLENNNTRAFIVLKDGKIALEKYFGTFTKDSLWYWASAGKTMTAVLVGIAQKEGFLSLSDTSSKWLGSGWTSLPPEKEKRITVWNQLTMTTGLDDGVADDDCTLPSCLIYKADAGTRWAYHNAPYTLLDSVIYKSTGETLNQFYFSRVRTKIGMNGLFIRSGSYNNVLYTTPRSMARFGLLMLNRGKWENTAVLSDTGYFSAMTNTSQNLNLSYGYLWWLNGKSSHMLPTSQLVFPGYLAPQAPKDMFSALGKNGQILNVVPNLGIVTIRMGDSPDNSLVPTTLNKQIWERLNQVIAPSTNVIYTENADIPDKFALSQNYPNPFNPETQFDFQIAEQSRVKLAVYDVLGREVAVLVNEERAAGSYTVRWNASAEMSGVYFCKLTADGFSSTIRLLLLR